MLSERISRASTHMASNKHDKSCKRKLLGLTVRRRKVLEYMMRRDYQSYRLVVRELGLRPLALFHSKHLPQPHGEGHREVNARNRKLKNRKSRGHKGH